MLKLGAWMLSPLLLLPLHAQDEESLPEIDLTTPEVNTLIPVPPPEIPFGTPGGVQPEMPKNLQMDNLGGGAIEVDLNEGNVHFKGPGVKFSGDNGLEVFADSAYYDKKAEKVTLTGNVSAYQGNMLQRGDRAVYYYERKFLDTSGLRVSLDPILLESGKFTVEDRGGKMVYVGEDAGITTHDVQDPNYWVRAKKTTIYPGEKIVFDDLKLYAGETPVFWLPYLSQPLDSELGYHFLPGSRSNWGPFLLNTYGVMLGGNRNEQTGENEDAWLLSKWHLDLRSRRGVGTGVDFVDTRVDDTDEISGLSFYYLNDLDPSVRRSGERRGFVNEDRFRVEFKHRYGLDFNDGGDWRIDSNLTLLSDQYYLADLEPAEYRTNPFPDNTLGIYRRDDASLLSLYARFRVNDFYRADTRSPEIAFDQARAPLFDLPVLHEGSTSFGMIGEKASDPTRNAILNPLLQMNSSDPRAQRLLNQLSGYDRRLAEELLALPLNDPRRDAVRTQLLDSSFTRFNTYQEVSMPLTAGNFLHITPQAGLGYTRYDSVDGPIDSLDRTTIHGGVEASVKFSKDLGDITNHRWGLNGVMHVMQPYTMWSVTSTNDYDPGDPMVDRLTETTRPRPLDPTRFTAVDEMNSWNVIRLGARNRLLTKRDDQAFEWLFLNTYIDAFVDDPEGNRNYSNLYNDVRWQPLPWMSVDFETQFPIVSNGSGFREINSRLRFLPTDYFEFSFGYRILDGHPALIDSNRVDLQTYTRFNDYWGFGSRHILEFDDSTLELQQYSVHRDLGNWVAGVGVTLRDNRLEDEYGVIFSLTLKDFPAVSLPFQLDAE